MFISSASPEGQFMAFPDVCKVPSAPEPFIPTPFPNMGDTSLTLPTNNCMEVLIDMMPTCTIASLTELSEDDDEGVMGGLISEMIMGPISYVMGSPSVMLGGKPATSNMCATKHNGEIPNAEGMQMSPSQTFVMVMS